MSQSQSFLTIEQLRQFSADGQVYFSFGYLIAARMGTLLLVPQHLVSEFYDVRPGCPVPCEEVHAVLDYPVNLLVDSLEIEVAFSHLHDLAILGATFYLHEWTTDHISPMVNGEEKVLRLVHSSGVRYAVVVNC